MARGDVMMAYDGWQNWGSDWHGRKSTGWYDGFGWTDWGSSAGRAVYSTLESSDEEAPVASLHLRLGGCKWGLYSDLLFPTMQPSAGTDPLRLHGSQGALRTGRGYVPPTDGGI